MQLNSSIIFEWLSEYYGVETSGKEIEDLVLPIPRLFLCGMSYANHQLYVGRVEDFPCPTQSISSLFVGVGGQFPQNWNTSNCHFLSIPEEKSVVKVFNLLSDLYEQCAQWDRRLCDILLHDASITEMISITIPVVGNPISFTNNRGLLLHTVVISENIWLQDNSICGSFDPHLWDYYVENCKKEGFHFYRHEVGYFYFSNIYRNGDFVGVLVVQESDNPLTPGRCALFRHFYDRICLTMENKNNLDSGVFNSIKSSVLNLLQGKTAPYFDKNRLKLRRDNRINEPEKWICLTVQPKIMPTPISWDAYSEAVDNHVLGSVSVYFENCIVALIPILQGRDIGVIKKEILSLLQRLGLYAGVSDFFRNPAELRGYYRQARHALELGLAEKPDHLIFDFRDHVLTYMLRNTPGDLPINCLLPEALLRLRPEKDTPTVVDYWGTLKMYLDNEMNTAQTARDLYIHRSTLQTRLDKIAETIPLDTPEQRFLARYYIYLFTSQR